MTYRTYESRIVAMLARCDRTDGMHRSEILSKFDDSKYTYIVRAIKKGVRDGSILEVGTDRFTMNWHHVNHGVERVPRPAPAGPTTSPPRT